MYLYGASGHAKVIIDILKAQGIIIDGLIDDNPLINELLGYKVYRNGNKFSPLIISIGNNSIRKRIADESHVPFGVAIHPQAIISDTVEIGEGSVVMQGTIIQACTKVGRHCIINTGASVDHECEIGDFVHVSPHCTLCGDVRVGEGSWIGAGSVIIPGIKIGKWSIIGAGSVVTKDIPNGVLAVGNRCKAIKKLDFKE